MLNLGAKKKEKISSNREKEESEKCGARKKIQRITLKNRKKTINLWKTAPHLQAKLN